MTQEQTIDTLSRLIRVNADAEKAFSTAATTIRNSELETLFNGYAKQHAAFQDELQHECRRLEGPVSESGTLSGAVQVAWMELKSAVSGHSASAILSSCVNSEDSAEVAYADAAATNPTGQSLQLIDKQRKQIAGFRTHLARLLDQAKNRADFQKNE